MESEALLRNKEITKQMELRERGDARGRRDWSKRSAADGERLGAGANRAHVDTYTFAGSTHEKGGERRRRTEKRRKQRRKDWT
jgi:hypothetical protein